jgi:hypothetical protein
MVSRRLREVGRGGEVVVSVAEPRGHEAGTPVQVEPPEAGGPTDGAATVHAEQGGGVQATASKKRRTSRSM